MHCREDFTVVKKLKMNYHAYSCHPDMLQSLGAEVRTVQAGIQEHREELTNVAMLIQTEISSE